MMPELWMIFATIFPTVIFLISRSRKVDLTGIRQRIADVCVIVALLCSIAMIGIAFGCTDVPYLREYMLRPQEFSRIIFVIGLVYFMSTSVALGILGSACRVNMCSDKRADESKNNVDE